MAHSFILFFVTFLTIFGFTIAPGLLNMSAVKITLLRGKKAGLRFSLGIAFTVATQAILGVVVSKYLSTHPEIVLAMQKVALVLVVLLALYFLISAVLSSNIRQNSRLKISQENEFLNGMAVGWLNVMNIPLYSGIGMLWHSNSWMDFVPQDIIIFVLAVSLASFGVCHLYVVYTHKINQRSSFFSKNINYILAIVMLVIAVIMALKIAKQ